MSINGRIYYLCPHERSPIGGVRIIYRHVDLLNKFGISSSVLHLRNGFRCDWFENNTTISYARKTRLSAEDVLVIPEIYGNEISMIRNSFSAKDFFRRVFLRWSPIDMIRAPARKVVFNQNCFYTFYGFPDEGKSIVDAYREAGIIAQLANSEETQSYLRFLFPETECHRIYLSVDPILFSYEKGKKKQICYMPRKNKNDAVQVLGILKSSGMLKDVRVVPIDGKPINEVAKILGESLVFLCFGHPEGFSLPPAEAMARGCVVVGYHGGGGKEFFKEDFCFPVPFGDILQFAKSVISVLEEWKTNPFRLNEMTKRASRFIQENYSESQEEKSLIQAWENIRNGRLKITST